MHSFVQQQMTSVGRIRLVGHPEAVTLAESRLEVGNAVRQQTRRAEPFAIDHETSEGTPVAVLRGIDLEVCAPSSKRLIEEPGQILDAVADAGRPVGGQREMLAFQHAEPGPPGHCDQRCRRWHGLPVEWAFGGVGGPAHAAETGSGGDDNCCEEEQSDVHGHRV